MNTIITYKPLTMAAIGLLMAVPTSHGAVGAPEDNGLIPASGVITVNNVADGFINNNAPGPVGVAVTRSGNTVVAYGDWAPAASLPALTQGQWTILGRNGEFLSPPITLTPTAASVPILAALGSALLGTPIPPDPFTTRAYTFNAAAGNWTIPLVLGEPKLKPNLFGDGFIFGGWGSYTIGSEELELADTWADTTAGLGFNDFPVAQVFDSNGAKLSAILSGASAADAETSGSIRGSDVEILSNGNILILGESRQLSDWVTRFGGTTPDREHTVFRIVKPDGTEVKGYSLVTDNVTSPNHSSTWHGAAVINGAFAVRFDEGGPKLRIFNNDGTPRTGNIDIATVAGTPAASGGRGDSVGFHGNGKDSFVLVTPNGTVAPRQVQVTVLNPDGSLRYTRDVSDDVPSGGGVDRLDGAIDESGRVIAVYTDANGVLARAFARDGRPLGGTCLLAPPGGREPRASLQANRLAVAWETPGVGIQARIFLFEPVIQGSIVTTTDNASPAGDGQTSLLEALQTAAAGDTIRFNIPGAGPHVIQTPMGGYPYITADNLTIDGYSQPGASPNSNPILGGNNAVLKIVLDSSGTDTEPSPDPQVPNIHRSTRLLFPGFGDSEDAILPVVGAKNVNIRGLSFRSRYTKDEQSDDPYVYCVAFVNQNPATLEAVGATGGHVNGCWFGLAPDGQSLKGGRASVATFQNSGVFANGLVIGTDGDGVDDRAEFNIHAAMSLAIHLQVPEVKVSGNYVNVLPNGNSFVNVDQVAWEIGLVANPENPQPQAVEFLENANCADVIIGTDGNGVADADERNIVANVSYSETMEFWRAADRVVVAGNYFGVGVDGVTPSPGSTNRQPDFVRLSRTPSSIRIGSNGDGVSDDLEGNLIVNMSGDRFVAPGDGRAGDISEMVVRRNVFKNCRFPGVPFADGVPEAGVTYQNYYLEVLLDATVAKPVLSGFVNGRLNGSFTAANPALYGNSIIDVYLADPAALGNRSYHPQLMVHPSTWLGSFLDNGPNDADPEDNKFSLELGAGAGAADYLIAAVTYSQDAGAQNAGTAVTSPMSNPVAGRPTLHIQRAGSQVEVTWPGAQGAFTLQVSENFGPSASWIELGGITHVNGNNVLLVDAFGNLFFRLISN